MNKEVFQQLIEFLHTMTLRPEEKKAMRAEILRYMNTHPVRNPEVKRLQLQERPYRTFINFLNRLQPMPIAIMLALMISGGASYAAENTLPGDALYPIKIHINEKVEDWLAFSNEAKASLHSELAVKRLEEAETLAAKGRLNAETKDAVEEDFEAHVVRAEDHAKKLEESNELDAAAKINADLEANLKAHEGVFKILASTKHGLKADIDPIAEKVSIHAKKAEENRSHAEAKISAEAQFGAEHSAEGVMRAAEHKLEEVRDFLSKQSAKVSAEIDAEAKAKLSSADAVYAEGKAKFEAKQFDAAADKFQDAMRLAEEAKLIEKINAGLDIKLHFQTGASTTAGDETERHENPENNKNSHDKDRDANSVELKAKEIEDGRFLQKIKEGVEGGLNLKIR